MLVKTPKTTSERLRELEELRIVEREVQQDKQRTVKYGLTELGKELITKIKDIEMIFK